MKARKLSTKLENRERERQKKRESKATGQRSSTRKEIKRDRKNKGDIFCGRNNMKFCSGGEKMRNASGQLGENERRWKKSEQEHVRHFLHKTCNQKTSGSFTL